MKRGLPAAAFVLLCISCRGGASSPTAPAAPAAPTIASVAGLWTATMRLTSITGGECVGTTSQATVGALNTYALQVTQNGSSLTAVATNTATGNYMYLSGTAGTSAITLNATYSSTAIIYGYLCSGGSHRDIVLTAATINAVVGGNSATGTYAESDNVCLPGTTTAVPGGGMTVNGTFTMNR